MYSTYSLLFVWRSLQPPKAVAQLCLISLNSRLSTAVSDANCQVTPRANGRALWLCEMSFSSRISAITRYPLLSKNIICVSQSSADRSHPWLNTIGFPAPQFLSNISMPSLVVM